MTMETDMILFSVSDIKIMTARHLLEEAGIKTFVIDKKDSAHAGIFGDIELYVSKVHQLKARNILIENEIIEA